MQGLTRPVRAYQACSQKIYQQMASQMAAVPPSGSVSQSFIRQMIPHHEAAIAMCRNILRFTQNAELQKIAQSIIKEQTENIRQMRTLYKKCRVPLAMPYQAQQYQRQSSELLYEMVCCMQQAPSSGCVDCDFIAAMIPHHKGAVLLCQTALEMPLCMPLVPLMDQIITAQCQGIDKLGALSRSMGCC